MATHFNSNRPQTLLESLTFKKDKLSKVFGEPLIICPLVADIVLVEPDDVVTFCTPCHMSAFLPSVMLPGYRQEVFNSFFKSFTLPEYQQGYYVVNHLTKKHFFIDEEWNNVVNFLDGKLLALAGDEVFDEIRILA